MALSLPKLHWFLCDDEQLSQFYCCGTLGLQQQSLEEQFLVFCLWVFLTSLLADVESSHKRSACFIIDKFLL